MAKQQTSFDRYLKTRLRDAEFKRQYKAARKTIDMVDALIRSLDEARESKGLTKADLAQLMDVKPEIVRRLLGTKHVNPTLETVEKMANALGYRLALLPTQKRSGRAAQKTSRAS